MHQPPHLVVGVAPLLGARIQHVGHLQLPIVLVVHRGAIRIGDRVDRPLVGIAARDGDVVECRPPFSVRIRRQRASGPATIQELFATPIRVARREPVALPGPTRLPVGEDIRKLHHPLDGARASHVVTRLSLGVERILRGHPAHVHAARQIPVGVAHHRLPAKGIGDRFDPPGGRVRYARGLVHRIDHFGQTGFAPHFCVPQPHGLPVPVADPPQQRLLDVRSSIGDTVMESTPVGKFQLVAVLSQLAQLVEHPWGRVVTRFLRRAASRSRCPRRA